MSQYIAKMGQIRCILPADFASKVETMREMQYWCMLRAPQDVYLGTTTLQQLMIKVSYIDSNQQNPVVKKCSINLELSEKVEKPSYMITMHSDKVETGRKAGIRDTRAVKPKEILQWQGSAANRSRRWLIVENCLLKRAEWLTGKLPLSFLLISTQGR